MATEYVIEKLAYQTNLDRGFFARASYLLEPKGDALIEIFRDDKLVRSFLFPAYKIWNIGAHFSDIVDSELANDIQGYEAAAWTGFPNDRAEPTQ